MKQFSIWEPEVIGGSLQGNAYGPGIQQQNPMLTGFRLPRTQDLTVPYGTYGNYAHQDGHPFYIGGQTFERVVAQVNSHQSVQPARSSAATNWLRMLFPKQIRG